MVDPSGHMLVPDGGSAGPTNQIGDPVKAENGARYAWDSDGRLYKLAGPRNEGALKEEIEVGQALNSELRDQGISDEAYLVVNEAWGSRHGGGTADLLHVYYGKNGEVLRIEPADVYSPAAGTSPRNIGSEVAKKYRRGQAKEVVVRLADGEDNVDAVGDANGQRLDAIDNEVSSKSLEYGTRYRILTSRDTPSGRQLRTSRSGSLIWRNSDGSLGDPLDGDSVNTGSGGGGKADGCGGVAVGNDASGLLAGCVIDPFGGGLVDPLPGTEPVPLPEPGGLPFGFAVPGLV